MGSSAVILVNLGTPEAPEENAIRRYLKQFLSDPRVVDLPRWLWLPILNLIILKKRPPKLVSKYRLIWGTRDGPIRNITGALARRLQQLLPDRRVIEAMTYGSPSLSEALDELGDVAHITLLPLFPQYAGATTGAVKDELARSLRGRTDQWSIDFIDEYHEDAGYIEALAASIRSAAAWRNGRPALVFSFHGIPQSQAKRDPYADQCVRTARLVAGALGLPESRWRVTWQSRFGPAPWLQPYTDKTMAALPGAGVDDVLVVCPGFSVDCLETIEEIRMQNRDIFLAAGGRKFGYVRALNASWPHARLLGRLLASRRGS